MLKYFSADWIFPVHIAPIKSGGVAVHANGTIEQILTAEEVEGLGRKVEKYAGAIVPGFINTHCHLELSHLLGLIPEQTGLVRFVQNIIKGRQIEDGHVTSAMEQADLQMFNNGIVAVGDISNQDISKEIKAKSSIYYHTFVEAMGFNPEKAMAIMGYAKGVKGNFAPLAASVVPHAPYSVSPDLFYLINNLAETENAILSIHNQETAQENAFFEHKKGDFLQLYKSLGLNIDFFEPTGKTSMQSWLPYVKKQKTLLVHNTVSGKQDIDFAKKNHSDLYWCLCPQANLYIENKLPDVDLLIEENVKVTLGTDSLASNHQLNILTEMKTLQEHKQVNFEKLLQWATINGAEFLNLEHQFGSIEVNKRPGLNLIQVSEDFKITSDQVKKLI